ncbi:MAG: hypothetical protein GAK29_02390 [Acinetobacter bereziniae]|uniref:Uncharacterized protein n=1 Tax=Acinetobacter bereziniae TaxID=106648 RepID=A0A833UNR7_ACIBZ|nr:MAG: hypothetical protein GAK29_02390 [Acinetobacter bereziniae]
MDQQENQKEKQMQDNFKKVTKSMSQQWIIASMLALTSTLPVMTYAAPTAPKLNLELSAHSKNKIKTLMNDPKVWQQIPKTVTLCVFSPDGANSEAFEQATSLY